MNTTDQFIFLANFCAKNLGKPIKYEAFTLYDGFIRAEGELIGLAATKDFAYLLVDHKRLIPTVLQDIRLRQDYGENYEEHCIVQSYINKEEAMFHESFLIAILFKNSSDIQVASFREQETKKSLEKYGFYDQLRALSGS